MNKYTGKIFLSAIAIILSFNSYAEPEMVPREILQQNQYKVYPLRQGNVYRIFVKKGDGCTTICFPSKIAKIAGFNVSLDGTKDFVLQTKPGSYYFNVVALKEKAAGTLTVTYNRNIYILHLEQTSKEAYAAVNFVRERSSVSSQNNIINETPVVESSRLISLIDICKTYDLMKKSNPNAVADVTRQKYDRIYEYGKFTIRLLDVFRFEKEDTVVFKLMLENLTSEEIPYDKDTFSAQVQNELHYMSVVDASGVMPPKNKSFAYFGITSTPAGGRNNLTVNNDWKIGVTTREMYKMIADKNIPRPPSLEEREKRVKEISEKLKAQYEVVAKKLKELEEKRSQLKQEADAEKKKLSEAKKVIVNEIKEKSK